MTKGPYIFGVRHLSPGAAWHMEKLLNEVKPELVLVEGPCDATEWIPHITSKGAKPPLAVLAYTEEAPVRSLLLPFAVYSPEYRALLWARQNKAEARFIDLPAGVFLALEEECKKELELQAGREAEESESAEKSQYLTNSGQETENLYVRWARAAGVDDYDAYWEDSFEHNRQPGAYRQAALAFGAALRDLRHSDSPRYDSPQYERETLLREAHMRRRIKDPVSEGVKPEKIVVVTGAFHAPVFDLNGQWGEELDDAALKKLPRLKTSMTLMPYSNLRLSSRSGYGAGNKSPKYFHMLWDALRNDELDRLPARFFTDMARFMREKGTFRSPAEIIEAVTLARGLAVLRGETHPTLSSLREAAVTCLGQGELHPVAEALAHVELGTEIGSLPEGISRTAIQDDFYRELSRLKLENYRTTVSRELVLDLRENRNVKNEDSRFRDLSRSRFLHRLKVLGMSFADELAQNQDAATWKEVWVLRWTPEAEIELVESALKGETVEMAASHSLADSLSAAGSVAGIAAVIQRAAFCGLPAVLQTARKALSDSTVETEAMADLAEACGSLSAAARYGDLRRVPVEPLMPLLARLFFRACLLVVDSSRCNNEAARPFFEYLHVLNKTGREHFEVVDDAAWASALADLARRDDRNPGLSGYAAALLMERGAMPDEELRVLMSRRLSPGIPADIGAGWFEGLARRNHYGLLSRLSAWQNLDAYLASLDEDGFKRALLFLRRAFADFSPAEKRAICDNLGAIWQVDEGRVEDSVAKEYSEEEKSLLDTVNEFDFGDL